MLLDMPAEAQPRLDWLPGDPYGCAFFTALSALFPDGERFLMDAVRGVREAADETLHARISDFIRQEATHSREHVAFNRLWDAGGGRCGPMVTRVQAELEVARGLDPVLQLAMAAALEHYTAIISLEVLADRIHLGGAEPAARDLWSWHATEEIEHKSVAMDGFLLASQSLPAPRRWLVRIAAMLFTTRTLVRVMALGLRTELARRPGLSGVGLLFHLWGRPGLLRRAFLPWLAYFAPGFHPDRHDDQSVLARSARPLLRGAP